MTAHACDSLPQTPGVSAMVRQIRWKLDGTLGAMGHPCLTRSEQIGLFDLGTASAMLDRIAILPGMSYTEDQCRTRLLELYQAHAVDPLEVTAEHKIPAGGFRAARGFTLIELMIVVAIIGILASIAVPAYLEYVTRSQVTEGLALASPMKAAIATHYAETGALPQTLAEIAAEPAAGKYVEAATLEGGVILIRFGGDQANSTLRDDAANLLALAPGVAPDGTIVWQCGRAPHPIQPEETTWAGDARTLTTIAARYLPAACRG